ncbi:putative ribonuclease H [Mycena albidolilacea]|uniref:ribonuclease H n=1 Tax=Mycena albidolilacea TaxID=1033008 RepID=A0AAD7AF00_9AGAR|nr:putative ribonuclease H [Mycena albidolilacea]
MGNGAGGIWTATKFAPPAGSANPQDVFAVRRVAAVKSVPFQRFCLRRRHANSPECAPAGLRTMCVFADGACINNGSTTVAPQAGCGFVFNRAQGGTVGFPLEKEGPDGLGHAHTSNRAELRAVIGALEFRSWWGERWERIVIVTDSTYVAGGATEWIRIWAGRKWVKSSGSKVQNQDLWELLSAKIGGYAEGGCEISFWSVPRKYNQEADGAATAAAAREGLQSYQKQTGILV